VSCRPSQKAQIGNPKYDAPTTLMSAVRPVSSPLARPGQARKAAAAASTIAPMSGLGRTALAPGTAVRVRLVKPSGAADGGGSGVAARASAVLDELGRLARDSFSALR
jgi:hypothetical protein